MLVLTRFFNNKCKCSCCNVQNCTPMFMLLAFLTLMHFASLKDSLFSGVSGCKTENIFLSKSLRLLYLNSLNSQKIKMTAFWDIAPCSLIEVNQHFTLTSSSKGSPWWWSPHAPLKCKSISKRQHGTLTQTAVIFILAAMRTLNLIHSKNLNSSEN
jgi:hypothetical protein